jgi:outer membrane protein TolC
MDWSAWKQTVWAWHLILLMGIAVLSGCQSGANIQDRNVLAMAGAIQALKVQSARDAGQDPDLETTPVVVPADPYQDKTENADSKDNNAEKLQAGTLVVPNFYAVREQTIDLAGALRLAGMENPTIGLAEEVARSSLAEQTLARSLLFPSLNVGTTLSLHQGTLLSAQGIVRNLERESLFFGAGADVRGAGTMAIPGIILTSHLGDAVFAPLVARQRVLSSSFDAQATRNQILQQVANAYLGLAGAEARVLALRQSESELAEVIRLTANFAATGQGREGDAQRARGEGMLLRSTTLESEIDATFWTTELSRLLSMDPSVRLRPEPGAPPALQWVDTQIPLETLIQQALVQRPEIAARGADVAAGETRLRQERIRPLVPTLSVGFSAGDFGGGGDQVGYRFSHFSSRADFDVLAVWTIQNLGFGDRAVQKKIRAEIGLAEAQRARVIDKVRREVAEALALTTSRRQQIQIAEQRVVTAQQAFREDLTRAKNLQGRIIEVLDSLIQLTAARQDLVTALVGYSQAQVNLYVALGNMPTPQLSTNKAHED